MERLNSKLPDGVMLSYADFYDDNSGKYEVRIHVIFIDQNSILGKRYVVLVKPWFLSPGFTIDVEGDDPHDAKQYLADVFKHALLQEVE